MNFVGFSVCTPPYAVVWRTRIFRGQLLPRITDGNELSVLSLQKWCLGVSGSPVQGSTERRKDAAMTEVTAVGACLTTV